MADESMIEKCQTCGQLRYVGEPCQVCFLHFRYGKAIDNLLRERKELRHDRNTAVR